MKPAICFVIGATSAGKSTTLNGMRHLAGVHCIEVGKLMRAKYGAAHFKGQASPAHTAQEAWDMFLSGLNEAEQNGKSLVLVDGQPRDYDQCTKTLLLPNRKMFLHLYAPKTVRYSRIVNRDAENKDNLDLAMARLEGDLPNLYEVLSRILAAGENVMTVDTSSGYTPRMAQDIIMLTLPITILA